MKESETRDQITKPCNPAKDGIETKDGIAANVVVRPMTEEDIEEAAALEGKTFSMPWKAADFLEMIKAQYAHYFVAEYDKAGTLPDVRDSDVPDGKAIVGIIGLRDIAGEGEITNVAVDEKMRGLGIGKMLLERALSKAQELGIRDVTLEVRVSNVPAIGLYESHGFKSEGIRPKFYEHPTEDAAIYWRREQ